MCLPYRFKVISFLTPDMFFACYLAYLVTLSILPGFSRSSRSTSNVSLCKEWGQCAQLCNANRQNRSLVDCGCVEGFRLDYNGVSCVPLDSSSSSLLITTNVGIQQASLGAENTSQFLYQSQTLAVAVDFLLNGPNTTIFWSDIQTDRISAGEIVQGRLENVRTLVSGGFDCVEGLAVDWIACNLYWVESKHQEIEVSRCDGSLRASVVGDVRRPRGLALDPRVGLLFWTDWEDDNPRIERSLLDGSARQVIVDVQQYSNMPKSLPNGITLDYAVHRVYWIDARAGSIHTVKYDGSDHKKILHLSTFSKPFSMDVFGDYFYWTDITYSSIYKAHRFSVNASQQVVVHSPNKLYQAAIVHPSRHPTSNAQNYCAHKNGMCSHLCVSGNARPLCLCPYGLQLGRNKQTCERHGPLLIYVMKTTHTAYFSLPRNPAQWVYPPLKLNASSFGMTYDAVNMALYWIEGRAIKRHLLKSGVTETFAEFGSRVKLTALSLDCLSGNLYIGNSMQLNSDIRSQISVCSTGRRYCSNLIWDAVRHVAGLTVDPTNRLVFWLERDRATVEHDFITIKVANLNGSDPFTLHTWTVLKNAVAKGLNANPSRKEVCWIETSSGNIMCAGYGTTRTFSQFNLSGEVLGEVELTSYGQEMIYSVGNGHMYTASYDSGDAKFLWNASEPISYLKHSGVYSKVDLAESHPCSHLPEPCHGICLPQDSKHVCLPVGGSDTLLVFLQNHRPVVYPVGSDPTAPPLLLQAGFSDMALDAIHVLATEESVVFASREHIFLARIDGYNVTPIVTVTGARVTALAADVTSGLLYRAVYSAAGAKIEVSSFNGSGNTVLVDTNLHKVVTLAVHPFRRLLFWSSAGEWPCIERYSLEDGERRIIVRDELFQVSDLSVDLERDLVYWCDLGTARIERARLDGSRRTSIVLNKGTNRHYSPVSVAVFQSVLFWIDSTYSGGSLVMLVKNRQPQISTWSRYLGPNVSHLQLYDKRMFLYYNETNDTLGSNINPIVSCRGFCFNGGTCLASDDGLGGPTCQCTTNFTGPRCQFYATYFYNPASADDEAMDMKIIVIPVVVVVSVFLLMLVAAWVKRRRAWQSSAVSLSSEEANPALAAPMIDCQYETSFSDNVLLMGTNLAYEETEAPPKNALPTGYFQRPSKKILKEVAFERCILT